MTNDALIFDAIRTPRGRGKATGALHEVKPVTLLTGLLNTLQERNQFDTQDKVESAPYKNYWYIAWL